MRMNHQLNQSVKSVGRDDLQPVDLLAEHVRAADGRDHPLQGGNAFSYFEVVYLHFTSLMN